MDESNLTETLYYWLNSLQETKPKVDLTLLRKIISTLHKYETKHSTSPHSNKPDVNDVLRNITDILWLSGIDSFGSVEEQILTFTACFNFLPILPKELQRVHFVQVNNFLNELIHQTQDNFDKNKHLCVERKLSTFTAGIFKTDVLKISHLECQEIKLLKCDILSKTFDFTQKKCLTYSSCTFLDFKNLYFILNKLEEWEESHRVIDENKELLLLYIISNNWENLISGVRKWNLKIWNCFLRMIRKNKSSVSFDTIINNVMEIPWTKAKYFSLCEIIVIYDESIINFIKNYPTLLYGIRNSLIHSSLISSCTSLYNVVLSKLNIYDDWKEVFLDMFKTVLLASNSLAKKNLMNYWMSSTLKKFPDSIHDMLEIFLTDCEIKSNYYTFLSFVKLCRKNGYILNNWESENEQEMKIRSVINIGLIHVDEDIRAVAFHIVCETNKKSTPCKDELDKARQFLEFNVNDDSTAFRQSNINSFSILFVRLHASYLKLMKNCENEQELIQIGDFFIWLMKFLHVNLNGSGNYQRKVTSLQMYNILLQYLSENGNNQIKKFTRKNNQKGQGFNIVNHLRKRNNDFFDFPKMLDTFIVCLKDYTDDIREMAADILINYFICNKEFPTIEQSNLFSEALTLCNSYKFYEVASGCSIFKVLAHSSIMLEDENIFRKLMLESLDQLKNQKQDLLVSLFHRKPLYGVVSALSVWLTNSDVLVTVGDVTSLKELLDEISNHFINLLALKSVSGDFPPNFAEMGQSIEEIISLSSLNRYDDSSTTSRLIISDAHQLALNCVWLNLKSCCELASTILIGSQSCSRLSLLDIPIAVLTKCRHKGAIEAAGVALGLSIRHLTSLNDPSINDALSKMLENLLLEFTQSQGGSVTRRSAGLTILVHRIVTNDSQDEKPLFHLTMKILLRALSMENSMLVEKPDTNTDNEKDNPLARSLHLLCRTVSESSLSSYIMQYAHQLADVCFHYLVNQHWQVRNAALQLYGALIPKLIGQRKNNNEAGSETPISVDELFCHIPSLWDSVKKNLENACSKNDLTSHSNIVPILSILSNTAKRYTFFNFNLDFFNQFSIPSIIIEDLLPYIFVLTGSPIHSVRNISAKIISNLYKLEIFEKQIDFKSVHHENKKHGYFLVLKYYILDYNSSKKYILSLNEQKLYQKNLLRIFDRLLKLFSQNSHSYMTKIVISEIEQYLTPKTDYCNWAIDNRLKQINDGLKSINSGLYVWLKIRLSHMLLHCDEKLLPDLVSEYFLKTNLIELDNLDVLKQRITNNVPKINQIIQSLLDLMLKITENTKQSNKEKAFEIMYILINSNQVIENVDCLLESLKKFINLNDVSKKDTLSYLFPLLCQFATHDKATVDEQLLITISKHCRQFSKPELFDEETRKVAAICLKHLSNYCNKCTTLSDDKYEIKRNTYVSALWLLQDENYDVRKRCAEVSILSNEFDPTSPVYQLNHIMTVEFLVKNFQARALNFLQDILTELTPYEECSDNLVNPFDHDTSNIYWEPVIFKENIHKLIGKVQNKNVHQT